MNNYTGYRIVLGIVSLLSAALILVFSGCTITPSSEPSTTTTPSTTSPATSTQLPSSGTQQQTPTSPVITSVTPPTALIGSRVTLNSTEYVVFAWNDLGMHCANPTYDKAVLLPPYNNVWAQVIKRGNPPQIVTSGLVVEYKIINNTYSYGKQSYGQFWDNVKKLFGIDLNKNTGLNLVDPNVNNGLSGTMVMKEDHFEANGIPVTPINDDGSWNPYQIGQLTVKDSSGRTVAQTDATIPVSDEINCSQCHGVDAFQDVLEKHDKNVGTNLVNQKPVLCASCHGDPALGSPKTTQGKYLSDAIHGFHSTVSPKPACYACHPGEVTECSRSLAHTSANGNCTTCHGDLAQISGSIKTGRIPWAEEPKCVTCHSGVAEVDTQSTLYRNAMGHGDVYCAACHSSPHAMIPTNILSDNYQALQYQGAAKTIGSCGACHSNSRGEDGLEDFVEKHAGIDPEIANSCAICHTSVPSNTSLWPHSFEWTATQGTGNLEDSGEGDERD